MMTEFDLTAPELGILKRCLLLEYDVEKLA